MLGIMKVKQRCITVRFVRVCVCARALVRSKCLIATPILSPSPVACSCGHVTVAKLLLEAKSDPFAVDASGERAVDLMEAEHRAELLPV